MTSGKREFKDPRKVQGSVEKEEKEMLEAIRWREHDSESEIVRKAVLEYIEHHKEGNNTFKLDKWNEDPNFKAVPTISSKPETWYSYLSQCTVKERLDIQILAFRINEQAKRISGFK